VDVAGQLFQGDDRHVLRDVRDQVLKRLQIEFKCVCVAQLLDERAAIQQAGVGHLGKVLSLQP
jgi:hypothetical protein